MDKNKNEQKYTNLDSPEDQPDPIVDTDFIDK